MSISETIYFCDNCDNIMDVRKNIMKPADTLASEIIETNEITETEQNIDYKIGKFSMMANSRARSTFDEQGFVKILSCTKTDKILGAHIIAREAGNTIHEIVVAMEFGGSAEDIARTCHAHPTYNEAVKEACLAVDKRQIHS